MAFTTHFSRKDQCTSISLICKRGERWKVFLKRNENGSLFEANMEHSFLYTKEEITRSHKANSTIRMYAIKILNNFFHLIFHWTQSRSDSIRFFWTASPPSTFSWLIEKKLLIDLEDAFVRFILFRDTMTHELLQYYKSQVEAQRSPDHSQ